MSNQRIYPVRESHRGSRWWKKYKRWWWFNATSAETVREGSSL